MSQSHSWLASKALAKATFSLFNPKLWMLSVVPIIIASLVWIGLAYIAWDPLFQWVGQVLAQISLPVWFVNWLPNWVITVAQSSRTVWIPFIILWLLIPAILLTALTLVSIFGVGFLARSVGAQYGLTAVDKTVLRQSISVVHSVWHSVWVLALFVALWVITMPLWLIPGLGLLVPMILLAWVNNKLFVFDVLAEFASPQERQALCKEHSGMLWALGFVASIPAFVPSIVWLTGAVVFLFLPFFAALALCLYVLMFLVVTSMYSHYLLPALVYHRADIAKEQAKTAQTVQAQNSALDAQAIEVETKEVDTTLSLPNPTP